MWESVAIRRLGMPESAGSNPAILTDLYCPVAQRWCGWLLTRRLQVRALPGQLQMEGRANWHDGTRLEAGRGAKPLQVRVLSLPLLRQGCAPGRAACLQNRRRGFDSFRPCSCVRGRAAE